MGNYKLAVISLLGSLAFASAACAGRGLIPTPQPISDLTCSLPAVPGFVFTAHWGALIDPGTKQIWTDPTTGKPWAKYSVQIRNGCSVPDAGAVDCHGAAECSILVTCPLRSLGTNVRVWGTGVTGASGQPIKTSAIYTESGRHPANCK
jgi:hypothetical protein